MFIQFKVKKERAVNQLTHMQISERCCLCLEGGGGASHNVYLTS